MIVPADRLVLLDSNVIVHLARDDPTGQWIEEHVGLTERTQRPLLSTVVEGEVLGLARSWGWGGRRIAALDAIFAGLVRASPGLPEIVDTYAELYTESFRTGNPSGENDLWIAATAKVAGAVLVTCDADFNWLHPEHVEVCYVEERW